MWLRRSIADDLSPFLFENILAHTHNENLHLIESLQQFLTQLFKYIICRAPTAQCYALRDDIFRPILIDVSNARADTRYISNDSHVQRIVISN